MITALIIWNIGLVLIILGLKEDFSTLKKVNYPTYYSYINLEDTDTAKVVDALKTDYYFMQELAEHLNRLQVCNR